MNGHEWFEWCVPRMLWGMGEFLKSVLRGRKSTHSLKFALENCHGISFWILCWRKITCAVDNILHLLVLLWNYIASKRQRRRQNLVRNVIISGQCIIRGIYLMHVKGVFKTFSYNEIMEPDNESITTPKNYLGTLSSLQKLRMTCSYYKIDCKWFNSRALL